jgi:hypothetical protein
MRPRKGKNLRLLGLGSAAYQKGSTAFKFALWQVSMFAFEQYETLSSLPFLIWKFSCGRIQKVVIIRNRCISIMQ